MKKNKLKMDLQMFGEGGETDPEGGDAGAGTDGGSDETIETTQAEIDKIVAARVKREQSNTQEVQDKLDKANKLIAKLEKNDSDDDADELQKQLSDYKQQIDALNEQHALDRKNSAIQLELTKANAKNFKAVQALIDMDEIKEQEDGTFEGLTDAVNALVESEPYLFESEDDDVSQQQGDITIGGNPNRNNRNKKSNPFADAVKKFT